MRSVRKFTLCLAERTHMCLVGIYLMVMYFVIHGFWLALAILIDLRKSEDYSHVTHRAHTTQV